MHRVTNGFHPLCQLSQPLEGSVRKDSEATWCRTRKCCDGLMTSPMLMGAGHGNPWSLSLQLLPELLNAVVAHKRKSTGLRKF